MNAMLDGPADMRFPVWNGEELAYEPMKLVFAMDIEGGKYSICVKDTGSILIARCGTCNEDEYMIGEFGSHSECMQSLQDTASQIPGTIYNTAYMGSSLAMEQIPGTTDNVNPESYPSHPEDAKPMSLTTTGMAGRQEVDVLCGTTGTGSYCYTHPDISSLPEDDRVAIQPSLDYAQYHIDNSMCANTVIPCGPFAMHKALYDLGINADICELNEKREAGTVSFRRFLSIFNRDALMITWPSQIESILEDYGTEVESYTSTTHSRQELKDMAIAAKGRGDAVIVRISLDAGRDIMTQHYESLEMQDGAWTFLDDRYPLHEVFIISRVA
ncbi:MAG: hypothetical protein DRO99_01835 [Candidatus Aenigmatarchaeota archaeon]|nr:MAG: hypothetical protein DRO99_01835 [Candidatus Aenigmarchaeota archaeon]